jgi:DNA-binding beta-propeller fold protein YncE
MSQCGCCYCAYLNPPWWVTMGYAPRNVFQGDGLSVQRQTVAPQAPPDTVPPVSQQPSTPQAPPNTQPPVGQQPSTPQAPPNTQPPVGQQPSTPQAPTDTQPPVTLEGLVFAGIVSILQITGLTAAPGVTVDAHDRADDMTVASTTTDVMGNFSLIVPAGSVPFDGYLTLTTSGLIPARVYVSEPLTNSIQLGRFFLTSWATFSWVLQSFGLQPTESQATLIVSVRDSVGSAVQVDNVSVHQNNTEVGYLFNPSTLAISGEGIWALNVPPGLTDVSVVSKGTILGQAETPLITGQMTFFLLITDQALSAPTDTLQTRYDITVRDQPTSLAFDGTNIWAICQGSISAISANDGSHLATFLVGGNALAPARTGTGTVVWVASSGTSAGSNSGSFSELVLTGQIVQTYNVAKRPMALTAIQDEELGTLLYFTDLDSDFLSRLDTSTGAVTTLGRTGVVAAQALLFDGTNFWVCNGVDNTVGKVSQAGVPQGPFPVNVGNGPSGLSLSPDGNSIWVTNLNDQTISELSVNDGQIIRTITTGLNPSGIVCDGTNLWVANYGSNTLTQIRASDGVVLGNLPTGPNPSTVVFDGIHVWVANSGSNFISRY